MGSAWGTPRTWWCGMRPRPPTLSPPVRCRWRGLSAAGRSLRVDCPRSTGRTKVRGRGPRRPVSLQHLAAPRVSDQDRLLLVLAPVLQGLGIEVRHHRTLLTRLAFPLIGLAAGGLHLSPSLGYRRVEPGCMASLALERA